MSGRETKRKDKTRKEEEDAGEEEAEEHDKYSRFFYKPHFLLALSTGTGELVSSHKYEKSIRTLTQSDGGWNTLIMRR